MNMPTISDNAVAVAVESVNNAPATVETSITDRVSALVKALKSYKVSPSVTTGREVGQAMEDIAGFVNRPNWELLAEVNASPLLAYSGDDKSMLKLARELRKPFMTDYRARQGQMNAAMSAARSDLKRLGFDRIEAKYSAALAANGKVTIREKAGWEFTPAKKFSAARF